MEILKIAYSPCPNDTFIFHGLVNRLVDTGSRRFEPYISDVEELNRLAFRGICHISKLSFHAYLLLKDRYCLLDAGSALGYGCGPLLVARKKDINLHKAVIAIPGLHTTAYLLLRLWFPEIRNPVVTRFDQIMEGVRSGSYDAGLIIHEGRFVFHKYGLQQIIDLGQWWEDETGLPIPLGCIVLRRDMDTGSAHKAISKAIRDSVQLAMDRPDLSREYVRHHAQELDESVIRQHIELYVNHFTLDLGREGLNAVKTLEEMAICKGIISSVS